MALKLHELLSTQFPLLYCHNRVCRTRVTKKMKCEMQSICEVPTTQGMPKIVAVCNAHTSSDGQKLYVITMIVSP
jgi:hypothetical protein